MELRRYRSDDLPAMVELHNAAFSEEHEFIPHTANDLDAKLEAAEATWIASKADRLVGAAFYEPKWYGNKVVSFAAPEVDPEAIEAPLLDRVEAEIDGDEAVIPVPSIQTDRIAFLEARGYEAEGGMVQLVTDLREERPIPELPNGYQLRCLHPDETSAFIDMVNVAYDAERLDAATVDGWFEDPRWNADWIQVVAHDNQLVAAVVARPDRAYNEYFGAERGYLGPAAVLTEHAQQGLGRALTAAALNVVRNQGMVRASLYTTQSNTAVHRLTEQLGFWTAHRWVFMKKGL